MKFYNEIKEILINNEITKRVKDYSKNKSDLDSYFKVGKILIEAQGGEARAKYGDNLIKEYSKKLTSELGKGYTVSALKRMRQFYLIIQKGAPLEHLLNWSHYKELLPLNNIDKINYYIEQIKNYHWSKRELISRIKSNEYERLDDNTKNKLINNDNVEVLDLVKNPIIINNKYNLTDIKENVKKNYHNDTIGIIICRIDNEVVIRYCLYENIFIIKYVVI